MGVMHTIDMSLRNGSSWSALLLMIALSSCDPNEKWVDEAAAQHGNIEHSIASGDELKSECIRDLKKHTFYVLIGKGEEKGLVKLNSWGDTSDCDRLYNMHKRDMLDLFFDSGAESVLVICYEDFDFQKPSGESRIVCLPVRGSLVELEFKKMKLRCQIDELFSR